MLFTALANDSTAGAVLYIAGTVVMTIWMRRKEFRQGGAGCRRRHARPAEQHQPGDSGAGLLECESRRRLGDGLLRLLFVLGLLGLFGFVAHDARAMLRHPRLSERQRRRFAAIGAAAVLLPSTLEVWWGAEALAHLHASPEEIAKNRALTPV
jgi:hypothetical protein